MRPTGSLLHYFWSTACENLLVIMSGTKVSFKNMYKNNTHPHNFRKDINGLRAVAVLAVLLFHMFSYLQGNSSSFDYFGGGYIGVDIFFVISGYLMTSIIIRRLSADSFSVWGFWKQRAARICPALLLVVALVLFVGFFTQVPYLYLETCREAMRSLLFISNFWFARDEGYFAEAVVNKSLLHTWSLSVEWQFYLIYPLLLWAWAKFCSLRTLPHFIAALFILSLGVSFLLTDNKSYFMLYTRAWELLIGGIIFTLPPLKLTSGLSRILEVTVLAVIFINIALAKPMQGWEPWQVLPSILASAVLLWLNVERSLLSNVVFQYTGKISYSMYLIHWPVIVFCSKLGLLSNALPIFGFIVVYSAMSYHFIETKRRWHWFILVLYILAIVGAQIETKLKGVTPFNDNPIGTMRYHDAYYGGKDIPQKGEIYYGEISGDPKLVIFGDSYARQYANFLNKKVPFVGVFSDGHMEFKKSHVYPIFKELPPEVYHVYFNNYTKILDATTAQSVVFAHNWSIYLDNENVKEGYQVEPSDQDERRTAIAESILYLADNYQDKNIYIVGQPFADPRSGEDCLILKNSNHKFISSIFSFLDCPYIVKPDFTKPNEYNAFLKSVCAQRTNLHFIDPSLPLCQGENCRVVTDDNLLIFSDGTHMSLSGAEIVGDYILKQIMH